MYSGNLISSIEQDVLDAFTARMNRVCENCGEEYGNHRGFDGACPHPDRFRPHMPFHIEGQFFSLAPNRCRALVVQNCEDQYGQECGGRRQPGHEFCPDHEEN